MFLVWRCIILYVLYYIIFGYETYINCSLCFLSDWDHTNPPHPHHPLFNKCVLLCKSNQGPSSINLWGGGGVGLCGPHHYYLLCIILFPLSFFIFIIIIVYSDIYDFLQSHLPGCGDISATFLIILVWRICLIIIYNNYV